MRPKEDVVTVWVFILVAVVAWGYVLCQLLP